MSENAIETFNLGRRYGEIWGLKSANFTVRRGELVVLVGPNGAGKTTTVKILTTILKPSKGRANILGMDIIKHYKRIRRRIAYLPQDYYTPSDITPKEFITWNLVARGWSLSSAKVQARKWLELLQIWDIKDKPCRTLSGGQRRRVAVAVTLSSEADIIFLDEPTTGLDPEIKQVVWRVIREAVSNGSSILLTTHDMREAEILADRVVLINNGITVVEDEPKRILNLIPFKYKVIVKNSKEMKEIDFPSINLGDRLIIYAKDDEDIHQIIDNINLERSSYSIEKTGLEDAYLYIIKGDFYGSN